MQQAMHKRKIRARLRGLLIAVLSLLWGLSATVQGAPTSAMPAELTEQELR